MPKKPPKPAGSRQAPHSPSAAPDERPIELIARALVINRGHVLTCWNLKGGYAYLPGGHVEFGERAAEALRRELVEELGVKSTVGDLALILENAFDTSKRRHHELNLVFHVELKTIGRSGRKVAALPLLVSQEPGVGFKWTPITSLSKVDLRPRPLRDWIIARAARRGTRERQAEFVTPPRWPKS